MRFIIEIMDYVMMLIVSINPIISSNNMFVVSMYENTNINKHLFINSINNIYINNKLKIID